MCFHSISFSGFLSFFWHQKWQNCCEEAFFHFEQHMRDVPLVMVGYLFKVLFQLFWQKDSILFAKLDWLKSFFIARSIKLLGMQIFLKYAAIAKKDSRESEQYHVPVQRSRTFSFLSYVTKSYYMLEGIVSCIWFSKRMYLTMFSTRERCSNQNIIGLK